MIGAGCFKKLLEVVDGMPCMALKITLGSIDELLVGVASTLLLSPSS
jgi:hypothetical protein